jgi:hypothetical protein
MIERFYYSASALGFCTASAYGQLTELVPDPAWVPTEDDSATVAPLIEVVVRESIIPADAVELSAVEYRRLIDGQANCLEIVPGPDGYPMLVPPPAPTAEQLAARAVAERDALLAEAAIRIAPLQDAVDIGEAMPADEADLLAWKQYRVKLNRITQQAGYPQSIDWPPKPA